MSEFQATTNRGFSSGWLEQLYTQTANLRAHNTAEIARLNEVRARKQKALEARQEAWEARQKSWETRRAPQQERIRQLLRIQGRWSKSGALAQIQAYFDGHVENRIHPVPDLNAAAGLLVRWQCVIYFDLIAGRANKFSTTNAVNSLKSLQVPTADPDLFRRAAGWLYGLEKGGYIRQVPTGSRYPVWEPTLSGAVW